ncbi:hypothetical protein GGI02_005701, partial [Coemansia sp. RSA 2322]
MLRGARAIILTQTASNDRRQRSATSPGDYMLAKTPVEAPGPLMAGGIPLNSDRDALRLLASIEGYLASFAGCIVEQSATGFPARTPTTPGYAAHPVAQKPPAYVIINDDLDLLRSEFESLRGTLTFSSSSKSHHRGNPFDFGPHRLQGDSAAPLASGVMQPSTPQGDNRSSLATMRRKGVFTATLGIIVLAPVSSMSMYRECVRIMSTMPHPLPPPV